MPRQCQVSVEDAVAAIKQFEDHFSKGTLPPWSDDVWKEMSMVLNGRWNFQCVYTNVTKNRRNILTLARQEMGATSGTMDDWNNNFSPLKDSTDEETDESDDEAACKPHVKAREQKKLRETNDDLQTFDLYLSENQWDSIKPERTSGKLRKTLQPGVWANLISREFWQQYRLPCAFVYKDSYVSFSEDSSSYILKVNGKCRSAKCANSFRGTGEKNLKDDGLIMKIETRDTRNEVHEFLKRPFNGEFRKEAQKELQAKGTAGYRKHLARENMRPGDTEPPFMPNATVARQAKKEASDAELGIKKGDGRDLIGTIEKMTFDPKFYGVVHEVGAFPFHVFYSTQSQLTAYKEYCRLHRDCSTICVDATGSIVRPLKREGGRKSGHIFLYTIVVNFDFTTVSVEQMLSKKHDTDFITYWLRRWIRKGAPIPKEAVCDYSRALLSALSMAFNNVTIRAYINSCFTSIFRSRAIAEKPLTRIRIDVAHLIHLVCRWKCFTAANQTCIKDFYVRCIALMVECQTLEDFKQLFTLTCVVALQTHEDAEIDPSFATSTTDARSKLEGYIAVRRVEANFIDSRNRSIEKDGEESIVDPFDVPLGPDTLDIDIAVTTWIDRQIEVAKEIRRPGKNLNAFYLPTYVTQLSRLCKEFPLWTSVGMPRRILHATSSYVEGYFNDVKTRVLKTTPLRVDAFMKLHTNDIAGANFVFSSNMIKHNTNRLIENSKAIDTSPLIADNISGFDNVASNGNDILLDDSDLRSAENWRGKGGVPVVEDSALFEYDDNRSNNGNIFDDPLASTHRSEEHDNNRSKNGNIFDDPLASTHRSEEYDDNRSNNGSIFNNPLSSTHRSGELIGDSLLPDVYLGDHSYSKLNVSDINLNSWTNEIPHHDYDAILQSVLNDEPKVRNNPTFTENGLSSTTSVVRNPSVSERHAIPSFLDAREMLKPAALENRDSEAALITTDVVIVDETTSQFKKQPTPESSDAGAQAQSGVSSMVTDVRSLHCESDQLGFTSHQNPNNQENDNKKRLASTSQKHSKYFRPVPEIRHRNTLVTKIKKSSLLPNGLKCGSLKINGIQYSVINTCAFDSLTQILMTAAIDNVHYFAFVKESTNSTLQFVSSLIENGVTPKLLVDRAIILKGFIPITKSVQTRNRLLSIEINAACCIQKMTENTLASEPSIRNIEECSHSGRNTYSQVMIRANFKIIRQYGFSAVGKALNLRSPIYNVSCRSPCKGRFTWIKKPNIHLIVMLDVRLDVTHKTGITCTLKQLPVTLELPETGESSLEYRLAGVVGYLPGHFVAYCRRATGCWQEYNDMKDAIISCSEHTEIEPHLALYIRL